MFGVSQGFSSERGAGAITPIEVTASSGIVYRIELLVTQNRNLATLLTLHRNSPDKLYLGRSDAEQNFGLPDYHDANFGEAEYHGDALFTQADVGKQIPIWLSSDPPPY